MRALLKLMSGISIALVCFFCTFLCSCNASEPKSPSTDTVVIDEMKFNPETITVNKGDTIVFINKDLVDHDVTEVNKKWASPPLSMGDTWKLVADESADYYCTIHVVMKGKIIVK